MLLADQDVECLGWEERILHIGQAGGRDAQFAYGGQHGFDLFDGQINPPSLELAQQHLTASGPRVDRDVLEMLIIETEHAADAQRFQIVVRFDDRGRGKATRVVKKRHVRSVEGLAEQGEFGPVVGIRSVGNQIDAAGGDFGQAALPWPDHRFGRQPGTLEDGGDEVD